MLGGTPSLLTVKKQSLLESPEQTFDAIQSLKSLGIKSPQQGGKLVKMAELRGLKKPPSTVQTAVAKPEHIGSGIKVVEKDDQKSTDKLDKDEKAQNKRRFKRWTSSEDQLLEFAIMHERGPPHNWKLIASKYFHGVRTALQVSTWTQ